MATITIAMSSAADGQFSKVYTLTEDQMALFIAAMKSTSSGFSTVYSVDDPPLTTQQIFQAWADDIFDQGVQRTTSYQEQQALVGLVPIFSST